MNLSVLACVCPTCGTAFTLKGSKLRGWNNRKKKKPTIQGPYCGYKCSGKENQARAIAHCRLLLELGRTVLEKNP